MQSFRLDLWSMAMIQQQRFLILFPYITKQMKYQINVINQNNSVLIPLIIIDDTLEFLSSSVQ